MGCNSCLGRGLEWWRGLHPLFELLLHLLNSERDGLGDAGTSRRVHPLPEVALLVGLHERRDARKREGRVGAHLVEPHRIQGGIRVSLVAHVCVISRSGVSLVGYVCH